MQILTDRAADLSPEQIAGFPIGFVPMRLTLDGKSYASGTELTAEQFYELLANSSGFPTTSQPSAGEFAELYREAAKTDPEILSIHISSGLSGTYNAARAGAEMVPEANVTFWDSKTLSCPLGWQVEAAARTLAAGWPLPRVLDLLGRIAAKSEGMFTIDTLKYLIHGGRISHLKGLLASVLQIRPVIGVTKDDGKYYTLAQERTEKRALQKLVDVIARLYGEGARLRVQLLHGKNPDGLVILRELMIARFQCCWTPTVNVAPILGAHTGKGVTGLAVGLAEVFDEVPGVVME
jgi:DegV family protein with EDD domain